MKNSTTIKNKREGNSLIDNKINYFCCLNNSFQAPETNNKLKLKYSFIENIKLSNFKKSIILKINQIQNNQQKTNIKLSSLISILFSKLFGNKNYKLFHNHFSIIQNKKVQNKNNENFLERIKTEENHTERYSSNNKKKIENISLASELAIKRYNLSNQKTKSKENIFRSNNEKPYNTNNKNNKKENEEFYNNSNNNLFRINNNYFNSLNKNASSENLNNSKKIFNISNNRKPITFNEITNTFNSPNNNCSNYTNKNKNNNFNNVKNNFKKININETNCHYSQSNTINSNNSINKEKDINKTNNSEIKVNKGPVKIKLNPIEKPILLMNFNENNEQKNNLNNIINISNNSNLNEKKEFKKSNNNTENKILSLKIEDSIHNLSYKNEDGCGDTTPENIKGKRKFSEARSEVDMNHSHFSESKDGQGYSRKIRGFNFRNNIKFSKKPNSSKISEEAYNKIKGGSVRYSSNDAFFEKIKSLEND